MTPSQIPNSRRYAAADPGAQNHQYSTHGHYRIPQSQRHHISGAYNPPAAEDQQAGRSSSGRRAPILQPGFQPTDRQTFQSSHESMNRNNFGQQSYPVPAPHAYAGQPYFGLDRNCAAGYEGSGFETIRYQQFPPHYANNAASRYLPTISNPLSQYPPDYQGHHRPYPGAFLGNQGKCSAPAPFDPSLNREPLSHNETCSLHLFGPNRPNVRVAGSPTALRRLRKAVTIDGLAVRYQFSSSDLDVFSASLSYHKMRGSWPANDKGDQGRFALLEMDENELLRLGITAADCHVDEQNSIHYQGTPPYRIREVNLDRILALMRMTSKYHDHGSPHGPRIWALGIVDKFLDGTIHAKLFPSTDQPSTHEVWLLREVIGDPHGEFSEIWRPFCPVPGATVSKEQYGRPKLRHPRHSNELDSEDENNEADARGWSEPQSKSKPRNLHRYNHTTASWAQYQHLSWEEILDEGKIPLEDFCGEVMLEIAANFSNQEISDRTNAWRPQATTANQMWQVIKRAVQQKMGTDGWPETYEGAFAHFEKIRVRNKAKREVHANRTSRIGKAPNKRRSGAGVGKKRGRGGRSLDEFSDDLELADDLPMFRASRVDGIGFPRTLEEDDEEDSDDNDTEPPTKRARTLPPRKARAGGEARLSLPPIDEGGEEEEAAIGRFEEEDDDESEYEEDIKEEEQD